MTSRADDDAERFLLTHSRVLEARRYALHFRDGPPDAVRTALAAYANPDGGFGFGLEPDKLCPSSQPLDVEVALQVLVEDGLGGQGFVTGACDHLAAVAGPGGLVPILTPDALRHPRAAHWTEIPPPGINPTAGICGFLHALGVRLPWLDDATDTCLGLIEAGSVPRGAHALLEAARLLEHLPDRVRAAALRPRVVEMLDGAAAWHADPGEPGYGLTPLHLAPAPAGFFAGAFAPDLVAGHLAHLARARQADGGWPISWEPASATAGAAWRGIETLRAVTTLRAWAAA